MVIKTYPNAGFPEPNSETFDKTSVFCPKNMDVG